MIYKWLLDPYNSLFLWALVTVWYPILDLGLCTSWSVNNITYHRGNFCFIYDHNTVRPQCNNKEMYILISSSAVVKPQIKLNFILEVFWCTLWIKACRRVQFSEIWKQIAFYMYKLNFYKKTGLLNMSIFWCLSF